MTSIFTQQAKALTDTGQFLLALAPRLPRMAAASAVAMFVAFAAIQFSPQTFEASLALRVPTGSAPATEAEKLMSQQQLGDVIARLTPDIIAELRSDGSGVLDTTALLSKRLTLKPTDGGENLALSATARTPARAKAIVTAIAESYVTLAGLPPELSQAAPEQTAATTADAMPAALPGDDATQVLQKKLSLAWEERIRLESRAQRIQALVADGNYAMLALDAGNLPSLGRQIDDLARLEVEREKLAVDLLPNHPRMRVLQEEIDQLSTDLDAGMQQLAGLVIADRDAARRLEDGLRDELIAATTPVVADNTVVTGAIGDRPEPKVTALPRPVRTDLVLGLSGGLAFFGQIGLFAFLRSRRRTEEQVEETELDFEPEGDEVYAPVSEQEFVETAAEDWVDVTLEPEVAVAEEPLPEPDFIKSVVEEEVDPVQPQPAASLDNARIVALHCRGDMGAASRRLLAQYQRQGRRVVLVDAASRQRGRVPGISDLSQGLASFADIVHGSGPHEVALVPWGRQAQFDPRAKSVRILIQALAELYDVVILTLDSDNLNACKPLTALADFSLDAADVPGPVRTAA